MDSFPLEIYDNICENFRDMRGNSKNSPSEHINQQSDRSSLAAVSRKWQRAIERHTFREVNVTSLRSDLDSLQKFVTGDRRRYIKNINYSIILPTYSQEACERFEREEERATNDEAFTYALQGLFEILSSWGEDVAQSKIHYSNRTESCNAINLTIVDIYSPMDHEDRDAGDEVPHYPEFDDPIRFVTLPTGDVQESHALDLGARRHKYSFLNALQAADLPEVLCVGSFTIHPNDARRRQVSPATTIEVSSKFPNLRAMYWELSDPGYRYPALRRMNQDGLVRAVESISLPEHLHEISLCMLPISPTNQAWHAPNMLPAGATCDPLSSALRRLTSKHQELEQLYIEAPLDSSLLWPQHSLGNSVTVEPFWQHLEILCIKFDMISPSGRWYFSGDHNDDEVATSAAVSDTQMPPGYGYSEEEDKAAAMEFDDWEDAQLSGNLPSYIFRSKPEKALLIPLLEAFARACAQMPQLRMASLVTDLWEEVDVQNGTSRQKVEWGIYYAAPGVDRHHHKEVAFDEDVDQRRMVFDIRDWRLPDELYGLFGAIGWKEYGGEMVGKHVDVWDTIVKPRLLEEMERIPAPVIPS
jgi:hypothetical protein